MIDIVASSLEGRFDIRRFCQSPSFQGIVLYLGEGFLAVLVFEHGLKILLADTAVGGGLVEEVL